MTIMAECNIHGEDARIAALHRYEVLDTQPEEAFDRITRLAKTVLQMPMVVVSLVDRDRQWFKSRQGVGATQTPRDISFCTHTIQDTRPLVVTDAHADPRFAASPWSAESPISASTSACRCEAATATTSERCAPWTPRSAT